MKTKQVPAIIMLLAGFFMCIIGFLRQYEFGEFLKLLLIVLILFYILGFIAKLVLDHFFKEEQEEDLTQDGEDSDGENDTSEENEETGNTENNGDDEE